MNEDYVIKFAEAKNIKELNTLYRDIKPSISEDGMLGFETAYKFAKESILQGKVEVKVEEKTMTEDMMKQTQIPKIEDIVDLKYPLLLDIQDTDGSTIEFSKKEKRLSIYG